MAINVNDVKILVESLVRKDQKTTYLGATEFNKYAKAAQLDVINQQRTVFESGTISSDSVSDLKTKVGLVVDQTTGRLTTPTDYLYISDLYVTAANTNKRGETITRVNPVDIVTDSQLGYRLSSEVSPPTRQRPIAVEYDDYFEVYPANTGLVQMVYIKEPADPVWAFTTSSGFQIYDSGNSTDFDLPVNLRNDLVYKICEYFGTSVRQADLTQLSMQLKQNK